MVAWPSNLPPPLRTVEVAPGNNTEAVEQASGRRIIRNWGHRSADQVTVQFRIRQEQEGTFKDFWHHVGMNVTWFEADWLIEMLYPNHKARLLGYPRRKGITNVWMDFSVTLLVTPAAFAIDGIPWPSFGTGQIAGPSPDEFYFAVSQGASPRVAVYPWYEEEGVFGAKISDPSTLPAGIGWNVQFTLAADAIAVAHETSPYISVYPWSGLGFGTKFSNPATLPTFFGEDVAFSPDGNYIAVATVSSPCIQVYPWSGSGFGTKFSNPATQPQGAQGVTFSPDSDYIAVADIVFGPSVGILTYPWSGSGFGTKFADPVTVPIASVNDVEFSPDGASLAIAQGSNPGVFVYSWSNGFGTKFANPSPSMPGGSNGGTGVAFSPDGNYIAATLGNSVGVMFFAYPWAGGFGTKLADPEQFPGPTGWRLCFSPTGDYLAMAISVGPGFAMYVFAGEFGGRSSNPQTFVNSAGRGVAFSVIEGS